MCQDFCTDAGAGSCECEFCLCQPVQPLQVLRQNGILQAAAVSSWSCGSFMLGPHSLTPLCQPVQSLQVRCQDCVLQPQAVCTWCCSSLEVMGCSQAGQKLVRHQLLEYMSGSRCPQAAAFPLIEIALCLSSQSAFITLLLGHVIRWTAELT